MPQVVAAVTPTSISNQVQTLANDSTTGVLLNAALDSAGNPSKAGFFGTGPVVQPSGGEAASARGQAGGTIATFATTATPAAVVTLTTAEITMTPVIGTGGVYTITSTDVVLINKPTAQAGIGYGNVRYASASTIATTFDNITAGTLTPTATQIYGVIGLRGLGLTSPTLTPASVASKTTAEQLFTITGASVGQLAVVNKPTVNAGLDIVGVRVAAPNTIGITFANFTAGTLTPTAGEVYSVASLGPIDASTNSLIFQGAVVGTQAIATVTTGQVTITSGNFAAQDTVIGVSAPFQAGLGAINGTVGSTTEVVTFVNPTAGTLTPTSGEIITTNIFRQNPVAPLIVYTQTLTPASVAANTTAEQTFVVPGVVAGSMVAVNKPSAQTGLGISGVRVSSANNIAITYVNVTATTITPASEVYTIGNFQVPIDTTTGNSWIQQSTPALASDSVLVDNIRVALVSLGLISGSL